MIIRSIIEKIRKDLREEYPELTPKQIEILAMKIYYEYQRIVLTQP
jgi:phage terminase Nu1 subunit (DNA packaging protein)